MVTRKDTPSSSNGTNNFYVGPRLREIRKAKGITTASVPGYTKGYVSSIETGRRPLPRKPDFLQGYAKALDLSPEELSALMRGPDTVEIERSNIPYNRNGFFIGREEEIERVHDSLTSNVNTPYICAITGISGIGKTTAAVEYAFRYREEYQYTLWVQADDTPDTLYVNFAGLAHFLGLPEENARDRKTTISIVKQWLQANSRCLLIFDNVDEASIQGNILSQLGKNHILLTTRTQLLGPTIHNVELTQISENSSVLLLLRQSQLVTTKTEFSKIPEALKLDAQQIIAELGGLPFALSQAATYIEQTKCGLSYYLKILQREQKTLLEEEGTSATYATIATWSLSFQRIRESNPEVAELLYLCAFLHPNVIYRELLLDGLSALTPKLRDLTSSGDLNRAIKELLRYSLVQVDPRSGAFSLHRLVQTTIRNSLPVEEQREWVECVVRAINLAFPLLEIATWPTSWKTCQTYYHQTKACAALIEQWRIVSDESRQLLHKLGKYQMERTEFKSAERVHQLVLELDEQAEKEPEAIIGDLYALAQFYQRRGNYKRAEEYYHRLMRLIRTIDALDKNKVIIMEYIKLLESLDEIDEMKRIQDIIGANTVENTKIYYDRRVINDTYEDIKYSTGWTYSTRRWNDYGNDAHRTDQPDASFQYAFTGYGIEILSDPASFQGKVDIFIDGDYIQTVNSALFEGQISQTIIFSDRKLGQGEHMIECKLVNGTFALDALAVYLAIEEQQAS